MNGGNLYLLNNDHKLCETFNEKHDDVSECIH